VRAPTTRKFIRLAAARYIQWRWHAYPSAVETGHRPAAAFAYGESLRGEAKTSTLVTVANHVVKVAVRKRIAGRLAVVGILLPYAVGIASTAVLGNKVGSFDFYSSGRLRAWDEVTSIATIVAYGLGLLACLPWLWEHSTKNFTTMGRLCMGCTLALLAAVQLVAVFVVRFLYYVHVGGIP
jgi:hypothetical protein